MNDTKELVKQARELCEKALHGPWNAGQYQSVCTELLYKICNADTDGNAEFIAASRTLVSALADALEKAQGEIERLTKRIETLESEQCDSDHENMILTARAEKAEKERDEYKAAITSSAHTEQSRP